MTEGWTCSVCQGAIEPRHDWQFSDTEIVTLCDPCFVEYLEWAMPRLLQVCHESDKGILPPRTTPNPFRTFGEQARAIAVAAGY